MRICYVEAAIGKDLTDSICRIIHKDAQAAVNAEIQSYDCEESVLAGVKPKFKVIYVDDWVDWTTVVVKLKVGMDRFILYHQYSEFTGTRAPKCDFLAEVTVIDEKVVRVERLHYIWVSNRIRDTAPILASSMPEVVQRSGMLRGFSDKAFEDLMKNYYNTDDYTIDYEYRNDSMRWLDGDKVFQWFLKRYTTREISDE